MLTPSGEIKKTPLTPNFYKDRKAGFSVMKVSVSCI